MRSSAKRRAGKEAPVLRPRPQCKSSRRSLGDYDISALNWSRHVIPLHRDVAATKPMSMYFITISVFGIASLLANVKADLAFRFLRRSHQLSDCFDDRIDFLIVLADATFEVRKFLCELTICLKRLTQFYERAHDGDVHFHRPRAVKHTRQHDHALLSEGVGAMTATATTFCSSKLEYQRLGFRGRKLKHEICWKSLTIASHPLIQISGGNAAQRR